MSASLARFLAALLVAAPAAAAPVVSGARSAAPSGLAVPAGSLSIPAGETPALAPPEALSLQSGIPASDLSAPAARLSEAAPAPVSAEAATPALAAASPSSAKPAAASEEARPERRPEPALGELTAAQGRLADAAGGGPGAAKAPAVLGALYDHGLLGPAGDAVVTRLEGDARAALAAKEGGLAPADAARRVWGWIQGNQAVRLVPLAQWAAERAKDRSLPAGWFWEHLEAAAELTNRVLDGLGPEADIAERIDLRSFKVLVHDDYLGTREEARSRLQAQGRPDLRTIGAFNLLGEKVLTEDVLLYPETRLEEVAAAVLHETLAAGGSLHQWVTSWVPYVTGKVFPNAENAMAQSHLEHWVEKARAWADSRRKAAAAPEAEEDPFDALVIPLDPASLDMSHYVGFADGNETIKIPFKEAQVHFKADHGLLAVGVAATSSKTSAPDAPRDIRFWWKPEGEGAEWQFVRLANAAALRDAAIHAAYADEDDIDRKNTAGPALSYERFAREYLPRMDRVVEDYAARHDPADSSLFVRSAYLAFRHNFARLSGLDLPELKLPELEL
jgi:hypothetical protein